MIESLDRASARCSTGWTRRGSADKTLVIFTSDNGGVSTFTNNAPLRDRKGTLYEGGVRVPMITRWPGHIPAASVNETQFCSIDLLPSMPRYPPQRRRVARTSTSASAVLDGRDLSAIFTTGNSVDRGALHWHFPHYHAGTAKRREVQGGLEADRVLRDQPCRTLPPRRDPTEENDLAAVKLDKAAELLADLRAWRGGRVPDDDAEPGLRPDPRE